MAVYKSDNKWYIKGKIRKDDGTYYHYHKLATGCSLKKEAIEYERKFKISYQDIVVSVKFLSFKELSEEYLKFFDFGKKVLQKEHIRIY